LEGENQLGDKGGGREGTHVGVQKEKKKGVGTGSPTLGRSSKEKRRKNRFGKGKAGLTFPTGTLPKKIGSDVASVFVER